MSDRRIVVLRKKRGLDSILVNKNGARLEPKVFRQEDKDVNGAGEYVSDYRGKTFMDTKHFISPIWDTAKSQYSWAGNEQDLTRLIDAMKLRYPKWDERSGSIIRAEDMKENMSRLTYKMDPVFNNPELYGKYYMENGRISLDLNDPRQEFLYLCYKKNSLVDDRGDEGVKSKYARAGSVYELVSPKKEVQRKKATAKKEVQAIILLNALEGDEDKMKMIAETMQLPGYSALTDANGLYVLLKEVAAQNDNYSPRYRKTYQDRFIELAEMDDSDLNVTHQVMSAVNNGIIRKRKDYYIFDGEKISVDHLNMLIKHFLNPANQEEYLKLVEKLNPTESE